MASTFLSFNDEDKRALRRAIRHFNASGKGTAPRPRRRRGVFGGSGSKTSILSMAAVVIPDSSISAGSPTAASGPGGGNAYRLDPSDGSYIEIDAAYLEELLGVGPFGNAPRIFNPFSYTINERDVGDDHGIFPAVLCGYTEPEPPSTPRYACYLITGNALLSIDGAATIGGAILWTPDGDSVKYEAEGCEPE